MTAKWRPPEVLDWRLRSAAASPGHLSLLLTDTEGRSHGLALDEKARTLLLREVALNDPGALHEALEYRLVRLIEQAREDT